ncbi:hypothetical protein OS493_024959 [Desmophyllum pertusum]|uniref:Uncharacterized protein n=1 Tax=Desmophyllum pertusum TaxID=174260 RepID=A0A9W9YLI9_9CNID|nr:hypothetical protein OS493_024959 [Desmophyllum pertusum]
MSDSGDNQEIESETTVKTVKRRGKKRTPTKVVRKFKKPRSNETSEGLLASNNKLPVQQLTLYAVPPPSQTVQQPVPQPPYTVPQSLHAVPQPPNTVPQPQQTVPQPPNTVPQPPYTVPQPPHTVLHPLHTVPQPPQTVPHPLHTMPPPPQTTTPLPHPGSNEGAPFPTFVQFTMPPNYFPSSVLNSPTPLQHTVPSSMTAPIHPL